MNCWMLSCSAPHAGRAPVFQRRMPQGQRGEMRLVAQSGVCQKLWNCVEGHGPSNQGIRSASGDVARLSEPDWLRSAMVLQVRSEVNWNVAYAGDSQSAEAGCRNFARECPISLVGETAQRLRRPLQGLSDTRPRSGQKNTRSKRKWGGRHEMFEKFNGTPLYLINLLTMQRTEYQVDGPLTEFARAVLGFGDTAELGWRAQEAEKESHLRVSASSLSTRGRKTCTTATSLKEQNATKRTK